MSGYKRMVKTMQNVGVQETGQNSAKRRGTKEWLKQCKMSGYKNMVKTVQNVGVKKNG